MAWINDGQQNFTPVVLARTPTHIMTAAVGDLDGNGVLDLVIHQVGRGRDNSQGGTTTDPIIEAYDDGTFVVTKHDGTGGRVSVPTVTEQLVYEMGDPASYITPDVIADFTTIRLEQAGENRVRVHCIRGKAPTDKLKVSIAYRAGFKAVGTLVYAWPDALEKAELAARVLRERLDRLGLRFEHVLVEYVGASATTLPSLRTTARGHSSSA